MIWQTWRQYWLVALVGVLALISFGFLFVLDANILNAARQQHNFTRCYDPDTRIIPCGLMPLPGVTWQWRTLAVTLVPLFSILVGVFVGAPLLAREYDQRTHLLAWTQSISPTAWLTARLAIIGGTTVIGFTLLSVMTTWWGPIQDIVASSPWQTFLIRGSVPVASTLFCLAMGVMIGSLVRRLFMAMFLTLLLLVVAQWALSLIYPYLFPPSVQRDYYTVIKQQHLVGSRGDNPQDLRLFWEYIGPDGRGVGDINVYCKITASPVYSSTVEPCIQKNHLTLQVTYQRFSEKFWILQIMTTLVLLVLSVLCTLTTYWNQNRQIL
jgi:hypothetical protein